jgi:hypothetical protein
MAHYDDDKRFSTWNTKVFDEIAEYIKGKKWILFFIYMQLFHML